MSLSTLKWYPSSYCLSEYYQKIIWDLAIKLVFSDLLRHCYVNVTRRNRVYHARSVVRWMPDSLCSHRKPSGHFLCHYQVWLQILKNCPLFRKISPDTEWRDANTACHPPGHTAATGGDRSSAAGFKRTGFRRRPGPGPDPDPHLKLDQAKCRESWKLGSASSRRPATLRTSSRTSRSCCRSRRLQDGPARAIFAASQRRLRDRARSRESSRSRRAAPGRGLRPLSRELALLPRWWRQRPSPSLPWANIGPYSKTRTSSLIRLTSASG